MSATLTPPASGMSPPPPQGGGAPALGAHPMGSSPAVSPTPNAGLTDKGRQLISVALQALQWAVPMVGATSQEGEAVLRAIKDLGKFGAGIGPHEKTNATEAMLMKQRQMAPQIAALRAQPSPTPPPPNMAA